MKIAISGAQCTGKSTLIKDFLKTWPMYKKADQSYREKAKKNSALKLNQDGNAESQKIIRDALIDEATHYSRKDNIIFDRCVLDNLVYTMWLNNKNISDVNDDFVAEQIPIIRESFKLYDIIFFIPILEKYPVKIVESDDGLRDLDETFRNEIDNVMKAVVNTYHNKNRARLLFPAEECPAIIEIFGTPEERIQMIKFYLDKDGKPYGEKDSLIVNPFDHSLDMIKNIT